MVYLRAGTDLDGTKLLTLQDGGGRRILETPRAYTDWVSYNYTSVSPGGQRRAEE